MKPQDSISVQKLSGSALCLLVLNRGHGAYMASDTLLQSLLSLVGVHSICTTFYKHNDN